MCAPHTYHVHMARPALCRRFMHGDFHTSFVGATCVHAPARLGILYYLLCSSPRQGRYLPYPTRTSTKQRQVQVFVPFAANCPTEVERLAGHQRGVVLLVRSDNRTTPVA